MNKNLILIALVLILIGLLFGGYFFLKNKNLLTIIETNEGTQDTSISKSFTDLFAQKTNVKCTSSYTSADGSVSNATIYVSGDKFRVDAIVKTADKTAADTNSHMISDASFLYIWDDKTGQGTKMAAVKPTDLDNTDLQKGANYNQYLKDLEGNSAKYSCDGWNVDTNMFTAPQNVQFIDLTEMTKNLENQFKAPAPGEFDPCTAICAADTGSEKASCMQRCKTEIKY